jgi:hypothetical protein
MTFGTMTITKVVSLLRHYKVINAILLSDIVANVILPSVVIINAVNA